MPWGHSICSPEVFGKSCNSQTHQKSGVWPASFPASRRGRWAELPGARATVRNRSLLPLLPCQGLREPGEQDHVFAPTRDKRQRSGRPTGREKSKDPQRGPLEEAAATQHLHPRSRDDDLDGEVYQPTAQRQGPHIPTAGT